MSNFVGAAINTADLASKLTGFAVSFLEGTFCEGFCEVLDLGKDMIFEAIRTGKINHETAKALESMDGELLDDLKQFLGQELKKYAKKDKIPTKLKGKDLTEIFSSRLDTVAEMVEKYADQHNLSEQRRLALAYVLGEVKRAAAQAAHKTMGGDDKRMVLVLSEIMESMYSNTKDEIVALLTRTVYIRPTECYNCGNDELHYDDGKQMASCSHCGKKTAYVINTGLMSGVQRNLDEFRAKVEQNQQEILAGLNALSQKMDEHDKRNSDAHTALHEDHETMRKDYEAMRKEYETMREDLRMIKAAVLSNAPGKDSKAQPAAQQQDNAEDLYEQACSYYFGEGVTQNYTKAARLYKLAADQGYAAAQFYLGVCYDRGLGVMQDYAEAVKWYRLAANQGQIDAQFNLGACYKNGIGVKQDYAEAVKWYKLAASQGYAQAQCNLGYCYENGTGVRQDYAEAVKWYSLAADQGNEVAQNNIGACYAQGTGTRKNYAKAVKYYKLAAKHGYALAQFNLGTCYYDGTGVRQDYAKAVNWYKLAADQGYARAQFYLGVCYDKGLGVMQDYAEAVKWYKLAADQGHTPAQYNLGHCYYYGEGVQSNRSEAIRYLQLAEAQGYENAKKILAKIR